MSPTPIRRRRRPVAALVAGALALVLLAGCTTAQRAPSSYSGVENNFMAGCTSRAAEDAKVDGATAISSPKTYCQCVFDAISDKKHGIPYSDFKKLNTELQNNGGPLPKDFQKAYDSCDPTASAG